MSKPEIFVSLLTRRAVASEATAIIGNMSKLKNLIKNLQIYEISGFRCGRIEAFALLECSVVCVRIWLPSSGSSSPLSLLDTLR